MDGESCRAQLSPGAAGVFWEWEGFISYHGGQLGDDVTQGVDVALVPGVSPAQVPGHLTQLLGASVVLWGKHSSQSLQPGIVCCSWPWIEKNVKRRPRRTQNRGVQTEPSSPVLAPTPFAVGAGQGRVGFLAAPAPPTAAPAAPGAHPGLCRHHGDVVELQLQPGRQEHPPGLAFPAMTPEMSPGQGAGRGSGHGWAVSGHRGCSATCVPPFPAFPNQSRGGGGSLREVFGRAWCPCAPSSAPHGVTHFHPSLEREAGKQLPSRVFPFGAVKHLASLVVH